MSPKKMWKFILSVATTEPKQNGMQPPVYTWVRTVDQNKMECYHQYIRGSEPSTNNKMECYRQYIHGFNFFEEKYIH